MCRNIRPLFNFQLRGGRITHLCQHLLADLVTTAPPKNREEYEQKRREKSRQRFAAGQ
jgi:hypothetical protein